MWLCYPRDHQNTRCGAYRHHSTRLPKWTIFLLHLFISSTVLRRSKPPAVGYVFVFEVSFWPGAAGIMSAVEHRRIVRVGRLVSSGSNGMRFSGCNFFRSFSSFPHSIRGFALVQFERRIMGKK